MKQLFCLTLVVWIVLQGMAQDTDTAGILYNSADRLLSYDRKLTIGGYGEVHYNQPIESGIIQNGKMDVHRLVLLIGYNFNEKTQFISEIEFEHVSEVYIEQAFLQHKFCNSIKFRAGLLLIPMGIINEYHEPTTFNGVERPFIDTYLAPTTWREIGFGLTGNIFPARLKYQAYIVNGFNGYDGESRLNGVYGFRKGRQKGAESYISAPNIAGKVEFYGIRGLNIGLSGYFGNTQSTAYNGLSKNNEVEIKQADSSVVGISMLGIDARYSIGGLKVRGQYYLISLSNTEQYNRFTAGAEGMNDLGKSMMGYYIEAGYNVFRWISECNHELIPFVRYETYNMHQSVDKDLLPNKSYDHEIFTTGISWKLNPGAVLKADMQFIKTAASNSSEKVFNMGFGVMF
jgi:hypothetical protein